MADVEEEKRIEETDEAAGEEDFSPEFAPVVKLTEVETLKSDADEEIVWQKYSTQYVFPAKRVCTCSKCKLYRFDDNVWKERGLGVAKILKHKATKKQRFIMHEDKTFKLRSNHLIMADTKLQQHGGNEKALVFSTIDFAEDKPREESLCIRFGTPEKASEFRAKYEAAVEENSKILTPPTTASVAQEGESEKKEEAASEEKQEVEKLTDELREVTVEENVEEKE